MFSVWCYMELYQSSTSLLSLSCRIAVILTVDGYWVYAFLRAMPPPLVVVFFVAAHFSVVGFYFLGKALAYVRWRGTGGINAAALV